MNLRVFVFVTALSLGLTPSGEDWWIRPDPPSKDKDLELIYVGDEPDVVSATYTLEGQKPVRLDLLEKSHFKIPASALRGKAYVKLRARGGGERGYRIVRFPSAR